MTPIHLKKETVYYLTLARSDEMKSIQRESDANPTTTRSQKDFFPSSRCDPPMTRPFASSTDASTTDAPDDANA